MDEQQQRITEDLAGLFEGELRFDPIAREMYATDGSLYRVVPQGVACPKHHDDVVTLAKYAGEHNIPLVARGAGTGVAGGALGAGLIVDFSRWMTNIESITDKTVRVQAGVVRDRLNLRLREFGRYFPPDPSTTAVTTVGGMLGVDAAGSHALRVGSARDHVQSIRVVLAGGDSFEAGREPVRLADDAAQNFSAGDSRKRAIVDRLNHVLKTNAELIQKHQPPQIRNCAGYFLRGIAGDDWLHLKRMLIGSEGTLGLFTTATLHTAPLPPHQGVALMLFGNLESALKASRVLTEQQPAACDLFDRRLLSLARESDPRLEAIIPASAEAGLLVEQTGFSERQAKSRIATAVQSVLEVDRSVIIAREAYERDDVDFLWTLASRVVPLLIRLKGETRALPFVEAIAVPPEVLPEFLTRAQRVLQRHWVTASLYAHAVTGQVHLRPFMKSPAEGDGQTLESLARELYEVTVSCGGTISGEHGDGLSRTSFLRTQYGPLYRVFQSVKDIFDPLHLLNPGKIVSDDPHLMIRHFRPPTQERETVPMLVPLQMKWTEQLPVQEAGRCNGCGVCRTQDAALRMCPFFRTSPAEQASPRAKANVLRGFDLGAIDEREIGAETLRDLTDLCFNCKQCTLECPLNIDIPGLVTEARARYVAQNGLSKADWTLTRAHSFGALGVRFATLANWSLNNSMMRWLIERMTGIARERRLPLFARRTFLRGIRGPLTDRKRVEPGSKPVIYFVDHFANYHDPELATAFTKILEHNRVPVHIPLEQTVSGMALITAGALDEARELVDRNVRVLAEFAREGMPIVCTEPTSAICLKQEYPRLSDHPDVHLVAQQTIDAGAYLRSLHEQGKLRLDFQPLELNVGYHTPCHLRALQQGTPLADLLGLIPKLSVHRIEKGCSGMAGPFGLSAANFDKSMEMGAALMHEMQRPDLNVGSSECSSCKLQMLQKSATPAVHPLKILAFAYGLMPELVWKFRPQKRSLTVTT